MLKVLLCLALASTCLGAPQRGNYYGSKEHGFQRASGFPSPGSLLGRRSEERFSGLDSRERFGGPGAGFIRAGGVDSRQQAFLRDSNERFAEFDSREKLPGGVGGFHSGVRRFPEGQFPVIAIIRDERQEPFDGSYSFLFETENGILREESGIPAGPEGAVTQQGSWSFVYPDGTPAEFRFIADENGYQVESDLLPTPPPLPPHAIAQIEKAERERAAGIIHDGQYREEDHFGTGGGFGPAGVGGRFAGDVASFEDPSFSRGVPGGGRFRVDSGERDGFRVQSHFGTGNLREATGIPLPGDLSFEGSRRFRGSVKSYNK